MSFYLLFLAKKSYSGKNVDSLKFHNLLSFYLLFLAKKILIWKECRQLKIPRFAFLQTQAAQRENAFSTV
jgi:hypothetical protein